MQPYRIELQYDPSTDKSSYLVTLGRDVIASGTPPRDPSMCWAEGEAKYLARVHAKRDDVTYEIVR